MTVHLCQFALDLLDGLLMSIASRNLELPARLQASRYEL